ncbi:transglutaminase domain-containing protein [Thermodesulfatator indicus DSM 15286]|uniref:Transglutaminase domain-containing protein n=1 Tax=Thermodesulfatator indicus (strain DSM 15286 / JCM 11887 / CIR29812) TaxID=667014 RepID=F8ADZ7_THEID|nr:transglutaminase domain-containing protein [Thermodesulfatator indicus]AEH44962.1 transglutaminase domain-containing protein [Thermodesulfatator indicus DSM 15286]
MRRSLFLALMLVFVLSSWSLAAKTYLLKTEVQVEPISKARLIELWVPIPLEDNFQKIESIKVKAPGPYEIMKEKEYGNKFLHMAWESALPKGAKLEIEVKLTRQEVSPRPWKKDIPLRLLLPDQLVPVETFESMAKEIAGDKKDPVAKLRAIYDYVITHMKYQKTGTGWGRGDAIWACNNRRGNCTDFHSLFMGLARAQGIPALFQMGLPVPSNGGLIKGYHCWLLTFPDGMLYGIDASEAAKHPEKREYFFGHLCDSRIALTQGRDILLAPAQHGPRLNFIYKAYLEVDLKPSPKKVKTTYKVEIVK